MRLYFFRHGQSENNCGQVGCEGQTWALRKPDPQLTPLGKLQAAEGAAYLFSQTIALKDRQHGHSSLSTILCSPMLRALETAAALHERFPEATVHAIGDLCEYGGLFEGTRLLPQQQREALQSETGPKVVPGLSETEIKEQFPFVKTVTNSTSSDCAERKCSGWWDRPQETALDCQRRAWNVIYQLWTLATEAPKSSVCIVSHGLFQDTLIKGLLCSTVIPRAMWPLVPYPSNAVCASCGVAGDDEQKSEATKAVEETGIMCHHSSDFDRWTALCGKAPARLQLEDNLLKDGFHFLMNNCAVSLIELSATDEDDEHSPKPDSTKTIITAGGAGAGNKENLSGGGGGGDGTTKFRCGILYHNNSNFSSPELLGTGHGVRQFSLF